MKGLPVGTHTIHVIATDVFEQTAETTVDYIGRHTIMVCVCTILSALMLHEVCLTIIIVPITVYLNTTCPFPLLFDNGNDRCSLS